LYRKKKPPGLYFYILGKKGKKNSSNEFGISKSKFAVKAIEEKIQKINKVKTNSIL